MLICPPMPDIRYAIETTPILDSGVLPPRKPTKRILGFAVGLGSSLVFAGVIGLISTTKEHTTAIFLVYLPILLGVVVLHELGHVAAGTMVGFHFSTISVGPFAVGLQYGRVKFQIRTQSGSLGYAGMHIETLSRIRRNLLVFIIGGPLTNLVSGTFAAVFVLMAPRALRSGWLVPSAAAFSLLSLLVFALSAIPLRSTLHSDGARIRMLLKSRNEARRWIAAMALASQQRRGVRPRQWKRTWVQAVCSVRDSSFDEFFGNLLGYIAGSDRKDVAAEARHLERCLELAHLAPGMSRDVIARESSHFCAWTRCDSTLAEKWLSQVKNSKPLTPLMGIRTEIALQCARGNLGEALSLWQEGVVFIERLPSSPIRSTLELSWQEWGTEIKEKSHQGAVV
jgi:Peptidase family M50